MNPTGRLNVENLHTYSLLTGAERAIESKRWWLTSIVLKGLTCLALIRCRKCPYFTDPSVERSITCFIILRSY